MHSKNPLNISIITLFPDIYSGFLNTSLIKRAQESGLLNFHVYNLLNTVAPKVRVDGHAVGPGPGMVIKPEVVDVAISECEALFGKAFKIFFSPQGKMLDQSLLRELSKTFFTGSNSEHPNKSQNADDSFSNHLILFCSRYEGVDFRAENYFSDLTISIGNYVLLGAELPSQVFLEGLLRLLPGVLGNETSLEHESFETPLVDHPVYCKPNVWKDLSIPEILQSGDHGKIEAWRRFVAAKKTALNHFQWFREHQNALEFKESIFQQIPNHYVVLMHSEVINKDGALVTTSIKSLDLHDISRASVTYGLKKFFVVQPLIDQQQIVKTFSEFWQSEQGASQHSTRQVAVENLSVCSTLDQVLSLISQVEKSEPVLIATSARSFPKKTISYHDQSMVWQLNRPVVIILGTGYGLASSVIDRSDFVLRPLQGLVNYNHLSVRSAAAIIFDKWLGLNIKSSI